MVSSTSSQVAFWLGLYAAVLSTLVASLGLYSAVFRRVRVVAMEGWDIPYPHEPESGKLFFNRDLAWGTDWLDREGFLGRARPVIVIRIINRGPRKVQLQGIWWWSWREPYYIHLLQEPQKRLPLTLEPESLEDLVIGQREPYVHGTLTRGRFAVSDGAMRIQPLRERWLWRIGVRRLCMARADRLERARAVAARDRSEPKRVRLKREQYEREFEGVARPGAGADENAAAETSQDTEQGKSS